jgi:hypothetical protein
MASPNAYQSLGKAIKQYYRSWAMPRLIELPAKEWDKAVEQAASIEFDFIERLGLIAGVGLVAYLLRFDHATAATLSLPVRFLFQFLVAAPLLVVVVGPVFLRRARRGLDVVLAERRQLQSKGVTHESGA